MKYYTELCVKLQDSKIKKDFMRNSPALTIFYCSVANTKMNLVSLDSKGVYWRHRKKNKLLQKATFFTYEVRNKWEP